MGLTVEKQKAIAIAQARRRAEEASHAAQEIDSPVPSLDVIARNTGEPFNRGVASMLDLPVTLTNLGIIGINAADNKIREFINASGGDVSFDPDRPVPQMRLPFSELGEDAGLIAPEGERAEGFIPRAFEFTGAGAIPMGISLKRGEEALKSLSAVPSILQNIGRATAANPKTATAFDIAANVSAAGGGAVARANTDNEAIIAMSELGMAFAPTALSLIPGLAAKYSLANKAYGKLKEFSAPWSVEGGRHVAAAELQDRAADPSAARRMFNEDGSLAHPEGALVDLTIAQRVGDPELIKLQNAILAKYPQRAQKYSDELNQVIEILTSKAGFTGGDPDQVRHVLNVRAQMAVENAHQRISQLKPGASPRQISGIYRDEIELALADATLLETKLWDSLDSTLPGELTNARKTYDELIAKVSPDRKDPLIPEWLAEKLDPQLDSNLMRQLDSQGWVGADGEISPALRAALEADPTTVQQRTFNDLKQIRSDVLAEMKAERAAAAPDRNRIRALNEIQSSLLDDLKATGVDDVLGANGLPEEAYKRARDFSRTINERYRQGRPGRLLGYDVTGAERAAGQDLLNDVWRGQHPATNAQALSEMVSDGPERVMAFFKAKYAQSVYDWSYPQGRSLDNPELKINPAAHKRFVQNLRDSDIFEVFPELELELRRMYEAGADALALDVSDTAVKSMQSRAALLLRAKPQEEMAAILNSENPVATTREVMSRLHAAELSVTKDGKRLVHAPDESARQGLKTAFLKEVFRRSGGKATDAAGKVVPNGSAAKALLNDYDSVMTAMHFSDVERARAHLIVDEMIAAQRVVTGGGDQIIRRGAPRLMLRLAQVMGARLGAGVSRSMGGGTIQTPGFFSAEARMRVEQLTSSQAEELMLEAMLGGVNGRGNPELFRALMLGPRASQSAQKKAEKALMSALNRLGTQARTTAAVGAVTIPDTMPELQEEQ